MENRLTPLERKTVGGKHYLKCKGPSHEKPTWISAEDFPVVNLRRADGRPYKYRRKVCLNCHILARNQSAYARARNWGKWKYTIHGSVPVQRMQGYLEELEARCGSVRAAAEYAGVSKSAYLIWQDRMTNKKVKRMHRATALVIITALRDKRKEQEGVKIVRKLRKDQRRRGYCNHCGCTENTFTPGCLGCHWRKQANKRKIKQPQ